jgi:lipoate-protein ligase B
MQCIIYQLGLVEYVEAYALQRKLLHQRLQGEIPDTVLLLEHPPTITIGKSGKIENILISKEELFEEGISLFFVNRGGDATYHGPGQLVGYPILDLRNRGRDVHRYVYDLEEVLLKTINSFSIEAYRDTSHAGVWVKGEEVAALGLSIHKWISMHGFALNVHTKLDHFSLINPCGFLDRGATSISKLLNRKVSVAEVADILINKFAEVFDAQIEHGSGLISKRYFQDTARPLYGDLDRRLCNGYL